MNDNQPSEQWLRKMADLEDECESVSVGGLASDLGIIQEVTPDMNEPKSEPPSQLWRVVWEGEFLSFQGTQTLRQTNLFSTRDEAERFVRKHEQAGDKIISCKQYVQMTGYDFDVFAGTEIASDRIQEDCHE